MSYELLTDTMDLTMSERTWRKLIDLALVNGWQAAGTLPPNYKALGFIGSDEPDPDWSGGYTSNDWQRVSEEDARGFADALRRALPKLDQRDAGGFVAILRPGKSEAELISAARDLLAAIDRGELLADDKQTADDWNSMDLAAADVELVIQMATSGGGFIIA